MLKIDETKLIETIKDIIENFFEESEDPDKMLDLDIRYYLYKIIQENTLNMDDDDIHKLFLAVEGYFDKGKEQK